jgi:acyl-coenzyme A synthetase/AMP-(fatty) acid ligase
VLIPSLLELRASDPVPVYPYTKTFAQARQDPFVVLHTSGSTGFPKFVILTHGTMAQHDTFYQSQMEGYKPLALSCYRDLRVFIGLGLFHSAAMCLVAFAIYSNTTLVFPSPFDPAPLTADSLNLIHLHGRLDASFVSPALLVELAKKQEYLENLLRLRYLSFGGGPLPRETGNILQRYTHLFVNFGATETGYFALHLNDPEDWEYMSFSPQMGVELRLFAEGLHELYFVRNPKLELSQGVFSTFPELNEYSTKDLFSKHPTKEGLWLFEGRSDDVIVCSTGQKINPLRIESFLNAHPSIVSASVCGQGRI